MTGSNFHKWRRLETFFFCIATALCEEAASWWIDKAADFAVHADVAGAHWIVDVDAWDFKQIEQLLEQQVHVFLDISVLLLF